MGKKNRAMFGREIGLISRVIVRENTIKVRILLSKSAGFFNIFIFLKKVHYWPKILFNQKLIKNKKMKKIRTLWKKNRHYYLDKCVPNTSLVRTESK